MTGTKRPLSGEKEVSQCKRARSIRNNIQSSQVNKILFKNRKESANFPANARKIFQEFCLTH